MIALLITLILISVLILFILTLVRIKRSSLVDKILTNYPTQVAALCRSKIGKVTHESYQSILNFPFENWEDWKNKQDELILTSKNFSDVISAYILLYFPYVEKVPHFADCKLFDPSIKRCKILIECLHYNDILHLANISNEEWAKRKETKIAADSISLANPDAIKELRGKDSSLNDNDIIKHQKRIEQIQKRYTIASSFEDWLKRQEEFSKLARNLRDDYADGCGCYTYDIQFEKPLCSGKTESATFKIWQIFHECTSPFYEDIHHSLKFSMIKTLPEFKSKTRHFVDFVYDDVLHYIKAVSGNNNLIVLLNNRNSFEWPQETFNYHYSALISRLEDENIDWIDVEELSNKVDNFQHNTALVFDFLTSNDSLKYISKMIIESFSEKIPNIVWYSMIKEYDEAEMSELCKDAIEANKRKATEEERKAKELKEKQEQHNIQKEEALEFIKSQLLRQNKHSFFSYFAITNTLIGEAGNSDEVKAVWLSSPNTYFMKSKNKEKKGFIRVEYSVDCGNTWKYFETPGNYKNIDDVCIFTYGLFKIMGVLSQFIDKGADAIDYMNGHRLLANH